MISRRQQILIKRAQREAGLSEADYRDALSTVSSGCRSSTDVRLTDRHVDLVLAYFEAIYWRGVAAGALCLPRSTTAVFRQPGYWARKNSGGHTSRDRWNHRQMNGEVARLEARLRTLGFGVSYLRAIWERVAHGANDRDVLYFYRAALHRTLEAKQRSQHYVTLTDSRGSFPPG